MRAQANAPVVPVAAPGSAEDKVRNAYAQLATRPGEWIPLADLRRALSDMSRGQQDEILKILAVKTGVQIIPWDNRNALSERDHRAALRFGGQENHAIRIES